MKNSLYVLHMNKNHTVRGNGSALNLGYQRSLKEVDDFVIFNQIFVDLSFPID